jgi:hypothetical protein
MSTLSNEALSLSVQTRNMVGPIRFAAAACLLAMGGYAHADDADVPMDQSPERAGIVVPPARAGDRRMDLGRARRVDARCAPPLRNADGGCVLDGDVTIEETLSLRPATHLDCRNHRLQPAIAAPDGNTPGTSSPRVALLLDRAYGASVENCVVEGFDIGVLVTGAKLPPGSAAWGPLRNRIVKDSIVAKTYAVAIAGADGVLVEQSLLSFRDGGGTAVMIALGSNANEVRKNVVSGSPFAALQPVWFPDVRLPPDAFRVNAGVFVDFDGIYGAAVHITVGDEEIELTTPYQEGDGGLIPVPPTGNMIIENDFTMPSTTSSAIAVGVAQANGTLVSDNVVHESSEGFVVLFYTTPPGESLIAAGRCARRGSRACAADDDCAVAGGDLGPCVGAVPVPGADLRARGTVVAGNTVAGPVRCCAIEVGSSVDAIVQDNVIANSGRGVTVYLPTPIFPGATRSSVTGNTIDVLPNTNGILVGGDETYVAGNLVRGSPFNAIYINGSAPSVRDNLVSGAAANGIQLFNHTGQTPGEIMRNRVLGAMVGFRLTMVTPGLPFAWRVSLNDFVAAMRTAVFAPPAYVFPAVELSVDGRGNYWGRTCADGGFHPFGTANPDSTRLQIVDSHPYGAPCGPLDTICPPPDFSIALVPEDALPPTCY